MADPFSIAASAIAVAGAGVKVAEVLYSFIATYTSVDNHIRPIAVHIQLTSDVLHEVAKLLRKDEIISLCQDNLLTSTENALQGCRKAFKELEDYVRGLTRIGKDGAPVVRSWGKITWNYRQKEIDVLRAHLESFKSSLSLVVGVLNATSSFQ